MKNQSIAQGKGPDFIYEKMKTVFENAKAIPMQSVIENRRMQLKLPAILTPDIKEVQTLLRNLGIDRKFQTR